MKSFLVYKFTFVSCSCSNIGEIFGHFKNSIEEHIKKYNKLHIFTHLHSTATCFHSYNSLYFKIIDKNNSKFDIKIKETLHINCRKPNLNAQQNNLALTLLLQLLFSLALFCFCLFFIVFCVSLSSTISIISDANYLHFYCINYILLLLHLITTNLSNKPF